MLKSAALVFVDAVTLSDADMAVCGGGGSRNVFDTWAVNV